MNNNIDHVTKPSVANHVIKSQVSNQAIEPSDANHALKPKNTNHVSKAEISNPESHVMKPSDDTNHVNSFPLQHRNNFIYLQYIYISANSFNDTSASRSDGPTDA